MNHVKTVPNLLEDPLVVDAEKVHHGKMKKIVEFLMILVC
jgi:hypothetical protein